METTSSHHTRCMWTSSASPTGETLVRSVVDERLLVREAFRHGTG
jgi:hypothetical protein